MTSEEDKRRTVKRVLSIVVFVVAILFVGILIDAKYFDILASWTLEIASKLFAAIIITLIIAKRYKL